MRQSNINVGTYVKVVRPAYGHARCQGKVGKVIGYASFGTPINLVEFDENVGGHAGNGHAQVSGKYGHCYYFHPDELELYSVQLRVLE